MKRLTRYAGLIAGASLLTAGLGGCTGSDGGDWNNAPKQHVCTADQMAKVQAETKWCAVLIPFFSGLFSNNIGGAIKMIHCNQEMDMVYNPETETMRGFLCIECLHFSEAIGREHKLKPEWTRSLDESELRLQGESGPWQEFNDIKADT